jgi:hypothetical protein
MIAITGLIRQSVAEVSLKSGEQDERPIARSDRIGQPIDLSHIEDGSLGTGLLAGSVELTRILLDPLIPYRQLENRAQESVRLRNRHGTVTFCPCWHPSGPTARRVHMTPTV